MRRAVRTAKAWAPLISIGLGVIGGVWGVSWAIYQQIQFQRIEAQKPFLIHRMQVFSEIARVSGRLINTQPNTPEWEVEKNRFYALRWSEGEMVGNPEVREAMRDVIKRFLVLEKEVSEANKHNLRWKVECLADHLRYSLEVSWGTPVKVVTEGSNLWSEQPSGCAAAPPES